MAVITVSPTTDISALIASDNVSPGDVLVLEDGEYFQTVNVIKDYLRIIAKGTKAVFDGKSILINAFILNGVTGVEVNGVSIMHYRNNGILIRQGGGNRIVGNKINRVVGSGIIVGASSENFPWKNEICNALDGIQIIGTAINNRIVENLAALCEDDGFESFGVPDDHNVFIGNMAINNGHLGMEIFGDNHLLLDNILVGNRFGGIRIGTGGNSVVIGNSIENSRGRGVFMANHDNLFFGENKVVANRREGIAVSDNSNNGIFQQNIVRHNIDTGISISPATQSNFVFRNRFRCNIPANILDPGSNNNYFANIDEPCGHHELQFEDCDVCFKDYKERRMADGYKY